MVVMAPACHAGPERSGWRRHRHGRLGERVSDDVEESALLLRCPAAEPAVGASRARLDLAARVGVPAHVTVTYPFRPVAALTEADHGRLERLFAQVPSFTLTGERTAWFGDEVLYVALERGPQPSSPSPRRWPPSSPSTRPTEGCSPRWSPT